VILPRYEIDDFLTLPSQPRPLPTNGSMTKTQQQQKTEDLQAEAHAAQRMQAVILRQVMQQLGEPVGRVRVQVRKLWEDRYRVNVVTGPEVCSEVIAHSFFLITDDNGTIVSATPRITKQY
jgi:hypothetical protein